MSDENMNNTGTQGLETERDRQKNEREIQRHRKERRRRIITAIVSVIIAVVLWMYVVNQENPTVDRTFSNIKVEYINEDELTNNDLAIKTADIQYVKVTVTGRRSTLVDLESSDIVATADLSSCVSGENYLDVSIKTPNMVELKKISPAQVKVDIDKIVSSDADINVKFSGSAEDGYQPVATRQAFDTVEMTGARQVLKTVVGINAEIKTSDLSTASKNLTAKLVPVDKDGKKVDNVTLSKSEMSVWAQLYKVKDVKLNTSVTGSLDDGLTLEKFDAPDTIKIAADTAAVDSIDSVSAEPVSLSGISDDTAVTLTIDYPDGTAAAEGYETIEADISVSKMSEKTLTLDTGNITVNNLGSLLDLKFNSPNIKVTLSGPSSALSEISDDDIVMTLDASKLTEGKQTADVAVSFKNSDNSENVTAEPAQTKVTVSVAGSGSAQ
ncbi:MAG: CdaR family protein [Eubacteriales bacterium]|nr:CdaR family protein [Eubacteriales bacterium]